MEKMNPHVNFIVWIEETIKLPFLDDSLTVATMDLQPSRPPILDSDVPCTGQSLEHRPLGLVQFRSKCKPNHSKISMPSTQPKGQPSP